MSGDLLAVVTGAVVTSALAGVGPALIRRLPEPALKADAADKIAYADLVTSPRVGPALALAGAVVGALVGWRLGFAPVAAIWVYLGAVGVVLAYVDSRTRLLPTRLIAPSYAVVAVLVGLAALADGDTQQLLRAVLGWAVFGGCYFVMWFIYPRGLGYGDVRLSGLLGVGLGCVGWGAVATGLYSGFLLGGVLGGLLAVLKVFDRGHFPFGPFMLVGALVGLVWGESLGSWYTSF